MTDYNFQASMLRGEMADQLSTNAEQFVYVLSTALCDVDFDEALEAGVLGDDANPKETVRRLRRLADAIEEGELS
ncbi:hypothetical protein KZZ08_00680 [Roseovarius mucosus]|uniref:hypothetical protein n=1 Tax=Roseovarius mucosus TaxID=215743 RepID=UPI001C5F5CCE|nr:hypothetical protein [Roseovarius mucosus]MBW4972111.1 hypothetical protein [Roseovarius mucosus]